MKQRERALRQIAERVEETHHRVAEAVQLVRPAVLAIEAGHRRVDEIEHFLLVALALGEFAVEPAQRVFFVAHNALPHRPIRIEEALRFAPRVLDQRIEAVAGEQKEAVVPTSGVERSQRRSTGVGDVDDGHGGKRMG